MVEGVNVFEGEHVYADDNLIDLSDDLSLGAFEVRKGTIWGVPITKRLELEFEIFEQLNTECPEVIIHYAKDNGFEPPKLWIIGG